jgi:hemolysin activation/secretion protein
MKFQLMVMLALAITPCRLSAEAGSAVGTNAPPKPAELVFGVRSYVVEGNDGLLPPEAIVGVLSNYTGSAVAIERLREGVGALQSLYRNRGFTNVNVELPHQRVTNGVVRVWVIPGTLSDIVVKGNRNFGSENASRASPSLTTNGVLKAEPGSVAGTNAPPKPATPVFEVRSYLVEGNHGLLAPEAIAGVLSNYTGSAVAFERLRQGLGALQLLYRDRGYATVNVALPHQRITNGVVRVRVIPGTLSDIVVKGNRYFSSENVRRALPSLTTNVVLNTKWFQPELDRANANPDRQIYPMISPGPEPETSALTLNVKDQLPLHGHMEVNDKSTPGTPLLRIDSAVQYNNLWQLEHQIGLEYNFSPQSMKSDNYHPNFYDQPMVASYSGFYRLPLSLGQNLRETYDQMPVDFGYDQVTHRFNLPPPTGNPELIVYASRSSSEMPTRLGPVTLITNTALADISSQS